MNIVQGTKHNCAYCTKKFELKPWVENQNKTKSGLRFCSKKCHSNYMIDNFSGENSPQWVGGITTYRGKGWIAARNAAVIRDGGICQHCKKNVGASIPVHHIKPFRTFQTAQEANYLDNLICLCQSCHMKVENTIQRSVADDDRVGTHHTSTVNAVSAGASPSSRPLSTK